MTPLEIKKNISSRFKKTWDILRQTVSSAIEHELPLHGAAIAFYTIFSIAPLLIIMVSLADLLLSETMIRQELFAYIEQLTGPQIAGSLEAMTEPAGESPSNAIAYATAIGALLFGATTVITQLKSSLNRMLSIKDRPYHALVQYLIDRLSSFVLIVIITGLFVISLLLEAGTVFFTDLLERFLPDFFTPFIASLTSLSNLGASVLFFGSIFRFLPDKRIPWKDIFIGAMITSLLFIAGKYLIGLYLGNEAIRVAYRAAGSFVIFIIWVYYNVQILLLGAEFTYVLADRGSQDLDN